MNVDSCWAKRAIIWMSGAAIWTLAAWVQAADAPEPASFRNDIAPILAKAGCNTAECHGTSAGKAGLHLSLFGGEPADDFAALTRGEGGRRINRIEPEMSLLLAKVAGALPHPMNPVLGTNSLEYQSLLQWIAQGAPWGRTNAPTSVALRMTTSDLPITSGEYVVNSGETLILKVEAEFPDGSKRDVTRWTQFKSSNPAVATISPEGTLKTVAPGDALILAVAMRHSEARWVVVPRPGKVSGELPANNTVDTLAGAKLRQLGIAPSDLCSDADFLRRVYLDVIGVLPKPAEARAFLESKEPNKRAKLIDQLLERDEFADFWALKWSDLLRIKSEYPVRVWPKGVATYYRWVRDSIAENKPYDQFARELLTASGSDFRDGPANFFRAIPTRDPQSIAESAALVFMGVRLSCTRCHGHPSENWGLSDDLGMAAFFSKVAYKNTLEWKEEIVCLDPKAMVRNRHTREIVQPRFLDGPLVELGKEQDPRPKFAEWLTQPENPWFARNAANRVWFWLMGRGLVNEPDDLRPSNPPQNPALLDYLAQELKRNHYDLKMLYRMILNSRAYQLSSLSNESNKSDTTHFSHFVVRRLTAEQLLDAVSQVTETTEKFSSKIPEPYSYWPNGFRAAQVSDGNVECSFLEMFGRPSRDTPYEEERDSEPSLRQALYFINSEQLDTKLATGQHLKRLLQLGRSDSEIIDELFLSALSRFPTSMEREKMMAHFAAHKETRAEAAKDVLWAILNTREFLFNH